MVTFPAWIRKLESSSQLHEGAQARPGATVSQPYLSGLLCPLCDFGQCSLLLWEVPCDPRELAGRHFVQSVIPRSPFPSGALETDPAVGHF